ncbi:MAG: hypothetical protein A2Y76_01910 [Planctomycetes bacterium RBG_13_60_9]|nr:MAG: hypothetical protein A2Y76_01910 [Planctomycetes bacterium RBG_13_60_9]
MLYRNAQPLQGLQGDNQIRLVFADEGTEDSARPDMRCNRSSTLSGPERLAHAHMPLPVGLGTFEQGVGQDPRC